MKSYTTQDGVITSEVANSMQLEMLTDKVDNNSLMIENSTERKNKTLNSEFFTSNSRTIVNAINKTYKSANDALVRANDAIDLIKSTTGNLEVFEINAVFESLKEKAGKDNLIEIINDIYNGAGGGSEGKIEIDDFLDTDSENAVQNKVITAAINNKQDKLTAGEGIVIEGNIISSASVEEETQIIDFSSWDDAISPDNVEIKGNDVRIEGETIFIDGNDTNITIDPDDVEEDD